jgi:hypothetical protein
MNQDAWMKYVPTVGAGIALVGFVLLGIQNAVLAGQVSQLSAEVTSLHELVAKGAKAGPGMAGATAARRMGRPGGGGPAAAAAGPGRRPGMAGATNNPGGLRPGQSAGPMGMGGMGGMGKAGKFRGGQPATAPKSAPDAAE